MDSDDLLISALYGDNFNISSKEAQSREQTCKIIYDSNLAETFYPKDKEVIMTAIKNSEKETFHLKDSLILVRTMMEKTRQQRKNKESTEEHQILT